MTRSALEAVLARPWLLADPRCVLDTVALDDGRPLRVVRDDLLHPFVGGNKLRKLDGLLPALIADGARDVVTCGGVQSSHATAVAQACAERGLRAHVALRGEAPATPTGYTLLTQLFAHRVHYVSRADYADRAATLERIAAPLREAGPGGVAIIPEGACEVRALYGQVRLVAALLEALGPAPRVLVTDSGTGTSAIGLAIGVALHGLDWRVDAVQLMPAASERYRATQATLLEAFCARHGALELGERLRWCERTPPRRFGQLGDDEVARCAAIARRTGMLLDPIYTLAAWDHAARMDDDALARAVMLHTGGVLNVMGVAQRLTRSRVGRADAG